MTKKNPKKQDILANTYPYNLLIAIKGRSKLEMPLRINNDILQGVAFALSTLEEKEQQVLKLMYRDELTQEDICKALSLSPEDMAKIKKRAFHHLRTSTRWCYMFYGMKGYFNQYAEDKYHIGYNRGYAAGYQRGSNDVRSGTCWTGSILEKPVQCLKLPACVINALSKVGYQHIGDLVTVEEYQIWTMRGVGRQGADKIARALIECGIRYSIWNKFLR